MAQASNNNIRQNPKRVNSPRPVPVRSGRKILTANDCRSAKLSSEKPFPTHTYRLGNENASIFVEVQDKLTAKVNVCAPDRPGLLQDVCSALTSNKISIESADITTSDDVTDNTFVIKLSNGGEQGFNVECFVGDDGEVCKTMLEKVKGIIVQAAMDSWNRSATPADLGYVAPEDQVVPTEVTVVEVETSITKSGKCMMVGMKATDRPGLLATTSAVLQKLNAVVISATVKTSDGVADNKFVIATPSGCSIQQVRVACLEAIK